MTTFAVVSLITVVVLGTALTFLLAATLQHQARKDGQTLAQSYVTLGIERPLSAAGEPAFWTEPRVAARIAAQGILNSVTTSTQSGTLQSLNLYTLDGRLLWTANGGVADGPAPQPAPFQQAKTNQAAVSVVNQTPAGPVLSVYVPVGYGDAAPGVRGIAEVNLPWGQTQALVRQATLMIAAMVAVGLLAAWLLLFRTVHRASDSLRRQSDENERLALHDSLTGLPNRLLLTDRLERAIAASGRARGHVALIILDVDRFKEVNDTLGHDRGDMLLGEVATRLTHTLRDEDSIARLGGDEFAILAPSVRSVSDAEFLARRISVVFDEPFVIDDLVLHVECSMGVAVLPEHADDATSLMQRADIAMYAAKRAHLSVVVYDPESDGNSADRLIMLGDLRTALGTGQLSLHYQPKIDLVNDEVVGTEALLRWTHPTRGNIPPNEFIPLAERTGLIHGLTRYVLELVVTQMDRWDEAGAEFAHLPVAVNLSSRNLVEPSFADFVEDLLASHDMDPTRLELEVTESALIEDPVRSNAMLNRLAALGVTIAVDDFGTGYTSMAQLEQMPLKTLKIDRSFVARMVSDSSGHTLVRAIVELAHEFGLEVVAEGVEDEDAIHLLQQMGCDIGQGFHWSRPVPGSALPDVLFSLSFRRAATPATPNGATAVKVVSGQS